MSDTQLAASFLFALLSALASVLLVLWVDSWRRPRLIFKIEDPRNDSYLGAFLRVKVHSKALPCGRSAG